MGSVLDPLFPIFNNAIITVLTSEKVIDDMQLYSHFEVQHEKGTIHLLNHDLSRINKRRAKNVWTHNPAKSLVAKALDQLKIPAMLYDNIRIPYMFILIQLRN